MALRNVTVVVGEMYPGPRGFLIRNQGREDATRQATETRVRGRCLAQVSDVEQIMGLVQAENVQVHAEAYDVALDMSFPKGESVNGGWDAMFTVGVRGVGFTAMTLLCLGVCCHKRRAHVTSTKPVLLGTNRPCAVTGKIEISVYMEFVSRCLL